MRGAGGEPGGVHRIDLTRDTLPTGLSLASTHAFGVAQAVGLARTLGLLPRRVVAYAVEGAGFDPGAPISPQVAAVVDDVVVRVVGEVSRLQRELAEGTRQRETD